SCWPRNGERAGPGLASGVNRTMSSWQPRAGGSLRPSAAGSPWRKGNVVSVRESAGTIYMNFGRRWSQALTVTISKPGERLFAPAGEERRKPENRRVRVRGWVEERNGPRIEVTRPEQIEIAERN